MKTIIIATDFSPAAMNAAKYAADMALAIDANLLLLHIYQVPISYAEIPIVVNSETLEQSTEKDLIEIKTELTGRTGNKINIATEVRLGSFFPELKTVCEEIKPYAVILGSQGTTAATRFLFGSHTVYAMKHLLWPLITVPPTATFSSIKKIGLACDFDKVIDTTPVDEINLLVNDFKASLHVLNTGKEDVFDPEIVFESGMLQEMLGGLKPTYHFISNENVDAGIIDFVEKNQIDLLLVLPKRHDLLDKLIHKSHTRQLVLHSHVPVMALHQ